jgi:hypothetical protein
VVLRDLQVRQVAELGEVVLMSEEGLIANDGERRS